jgi:Fe-S-cluster containining protein
LKETLERYLELLEKTDRLASEIRSRHLNSIHCARGCHSCCKPGLAVNELEAERIRKALAEDAERLPALMETEAADPFRGTRCAFLQPGGACGIYEFRPLVCRTHGLPLQFKDPDREGVRLRDVCGLNSCLSSPPVPPRRYVLDNFTEKTGKACQRIGPCRQGNQ